MESSVMDSLTAIANVVGLPACLLVGWLFFQVRTNTKKIEELEKAREEDRKDADGKLSEIYAKLNSLASDVSFIRGKLEN